MPPEIDPLKMALRCQVTRQPVECCVICPFCKEVEQYGMLRYACNPDEIFKAALARIESQEAALMDPKTMLVDTLVLRLNVFLRENLIDDVRARIAEQLAKGDGVVVVPSYFDVMFVPKGTTVSIEDCIKKPE